MSTPVDPAASDEPITRVSTLELFFDLVFVFTITQLTQLLAHDPTWTSALQAALLLAVIWWMYGGYAWLTNEVRADRVGRRVGLLAAMGCFLAMSLAVPKVFHGHGAVFGIAYLGVILIHGALFARTEHRQVLRAIVRVVPYNLAAATLVLAATLVHGTVTYALLGAAVVLSWGWVGLTSSRGFNLSAAHFVERHGLVMIVAIGESVVEIGEGVGDQSLTPVVLLTAGLALALSAALWWACFGGDDARSERALEQVPQGLRGRAGILSFGYAQGLMLFGVIALSAGVKLALADPRAELPAAPALLLGAGASAFIAANVAFRWSLRLDRGALRALAAALALVTIPLGVRASALAQIALLVAVFGGLYAAEWWRSRGTLEVASAP
jgi:low temperature requirement protein LtrA